MDRAPSPPLLFRQNRGMSIFSRDQHGRMVNFANLIASLNHMRGRNNVGIARNIGSRLRGRRLPAPVPHRRDNCPFDRSPGVEMTYRLPAVFGDQ